VLPGRVASRPADAFVRGRDLSTTKPVAAFSRTAVMPAAAALMVLNNGETATTVPSGAVSLKKYAFSPASAISKMPANLLPSQIHASLHRPVQPERLPAFSSLTGLMDRTQRYRRVRYGRRFPLPYFALS
jgi:hypothetical protein